MADLQTNRPGIRRIDCLRDSLDDFRRRLTFNVEEHEHLVAIGALANSHSLDIDALFAQNGAHATHLAGLVGVRENQGVVARHHVESITQN